MNDSWTRAAWEHAEGFKPGDAPGFGEHWTEAEKAEATTLIEKRREERRLIDASLERQKRLDAHHQGVLEGTIWRTADGRELEVSEMTPDHALKTLRMLEAGRHVTGRWAIQNGEFVEGHVALGYTLPCRFGRWPLTEALWKRSQETPTIRERLRDYLSYRAYKKRS